VRIEDIMPKETRQWIRCDTSYDIGCGV